LVNKVVVFKQLQEKLLELGPLFGAQAGTMWAIGCSWSGVRVGAGLFDPMPQVLVGLLAKPAKAS
jgi:hypothetical protein